MDKEIDKLNSQFGIPDSLEFVENSGLIAVNITGNLRNPQFFCTVLI